jgi:hypothetical protein
MGIADTLSDAVEAIQQYLSKSDEDATRDMGVSTNYGIGREGVQF